MSIRTSRERTRQRRLGLVSAGVVIAGLMAAAPTATAAPAPAQGNDKVVTGGGVRYSDGRYVVLLREPSAARYTGSNPRYAATKARGDGQFRADSTHGPRLHGAPARHPGGIAREVGAKPVTDYTIASNGFAASLTGEPGSALAADRRVLLVEKARRVKLDTWNSPELPRADRQERRLDQPRRPANAGGGVVVGDLDSGIWPESKSFAGGALTVDPQDQWDISAAATRTRMEKADGRVFTGDVRDR